MTEEKTSAQALSETNIRLNERIEELEIEIRRFITNKEALEDRIEELHADLAQKTKKINVLLKTIKDLMK